MVRPLVLLAETDSAFRHTVKSCLLQQRFAIAESVTCESLLRSYRSARPDLILLNSCLENRYDGLEAARRLRREGSQVPLVLLTRQSSEQLAVAAIKAGINDYFIQPVRLEEITASIERWLRPGRPAPGTAAPASPSLLIGESQAIREVRDYIARVGATDSNVLVTGETGTGKELAAELIHRASPRHPKPLVSLNCAAIPDTLLESELFGYERGAFTGADANKEGHLQAAHGGTLFLDEVGDMSPYAQAKVLRVLEGKPVQRLGGTRALSVDVRVVAATNQELDRAMSEGRFRRDLYYRLHVAHVAMPPLRERREDIPLLLESFLRLLNRRFKRQVEGFAPEALALLAGYSWPGNVRELRNLLEAVFVGLPVGTDTIDVGDLPEPLRRAGGIAPTPRQPERERLLAALTAAGGNKCRAAADLGCSRMTLYRRMAKYGLVLLPPAAPH